MPEDLDTKLEDHVCDEWRYMAMLSPMAPPVQKEKKELPYDPLGIDWAAMRRNNGISIVG
jgi:hypothetical protein